MFTLEQVKTLIPQNNMAELKIADLIFKVKTYLTPAELLVLVDDIIDASYINDITPSIIMFDIAFQIETTKAICPEFPFAMREDGLIDIEESYRIITAINLLGVYSTKFASSDCHCDVTSIVDQVLDAALTGFNHRNEKLLAYASSNSAIEETLENLNNVCLNLGTLIKTGIELLDKNGAKISKLLTPKKIEKFMTDLKESVVKTHVEAAE